MLNLQAFPKLLGALLASAVLAGGAAAESYPNRQITFVVPFTAGGITDNVARTAGKKLSSILGQPVVIENKAGAGGSIGADYALRSKPDGYTIFLGTQGTQVTNPLMYDAVRYDSLKDFTAVHGLTALPNVVVVNASRPYKSLEDLVDYAKKHPGHLTNSSAGTGTGTHLSAELFQAKAGVKFTHVPYKGSAPSITDLMGGQVDLSFDYYVSTRAGIKDGRLRPLAVTGEQRLPELPEIKTMTELGYPEATSIIWMGVFVPSGTPPEIVKTLDDALGKVLQDPEVIEAYKGFGGETLPKSSVEFTQYIQSEMKKWRDVVDIAGLAKK